MHCDLPSYLIPVTALLFAILPSEAVIYGKISNEVNDQANMRHKRQFPSLCRIETLECFSGVHDCQNGASCESEPVVTNTGGVQCEKICVCAPQYTGTLCEIQINETTTTSPTITNTTSNTTTTTTSIITNLTTPTISTPITSPTPDPNACFQNMFRCAAGYCLHSGQCVVDQSAPGCPISCICSSDYTGELCEIPLEDISSTSNPPTNSTAATSNTTCAPHINCTHGTCPEPDICQCDEGYVFTGTNCEQCVLTCRNNGVCGYNRARQTQQCECPGRYTGDLCNCAQGMNCNPGYCPIPRVCMCADGYHHTGAFCEPEVTTSITNTTSPSVAPDTSNSTTPTNSAPPSVVNVTGTPNHNTSITTEVMNTTTTNSPTTSVNCFQIQLKCFGGRICRNGGNCSINNTAPGCAVICACPARFTGEFCEIDTNCSPHLNCSGTCPAPDTCRPMCPEGYMTTDYGCQQCDLACKNGGQCIFNETEGTQRCECVGRFAGRLCNCNEGMNCNPGYCPAPHICECDAGYISNKAGCKPFCDPPCINNGSCVNSNGTTVCTCKDPYRGNYCEMLITTPQPVTSVVETFVSVPESSQDYWYPLGISLGILFLLIILAVVVPYILWRRRAILMMKFLYRFQKFEDDDSLRFDAFVSYKSSTADYDSSPEEMFVLNSLMPKLEKEMGFKLCVHFRDFVPGVAIVDNVLDAIQNSRRTIMLVSKRYIEESIWCKFEYEQAHLAVLEKKQRIIPIIYENIDGVQMEDEKLKLILKSTTYLEWPQDDDDKLKDKFWTRLNLSMPKLRSLQPKDNPVVSKSGTFKKLESAMSVDSGISLYPCIEGGCLPISDDFVNIDLDDEDGVRYHNGYVNSYPHSRENGVTISTVC